MASRQKHQRRPAAGVAYLQQLRRHECGARVVDAFAQRCAICDKGFQCTTAVPVMRLVDMLLLDVPDRRLPQQVAPIAQIGEQEA